MYHNSGESLSHSGFVVPNIILMIYIGDLSDREGYDFEQLRSLAKVQVCVLIITTLLRLSLHLNPCSSRRFFMLLDTILSIELGQT